MEQNIKDQKQPHIPAPAGLPRANEQGQLNIDDFVRIFDPNNQQILVEKRS
jgi:hypothetical protein